MNKQEEIKKQIEEIKEKADKAIELLEKELAKEQGFFKPTDTFYFVNNMGIS